MSIKDLHNRAMELADLADLEKSRGNKDKANSLYEQSYNIESEAAMKAYNERIGEPSISVLLRSAASLAVGCQKNREAEKLIELGLSGEPPTEIADELRDLLDQVYLKNLEEAIEKYNNNRQIMIAAGKTVSDCKYVVELPVVANKVALSI